MNDLWHHNDCQGDGATSLPMQVLWADDAPVPCHPMGHDGAISVLRRHPVVRIYETEVRWRATMMWLLLELSCQCRCADKA